VANPDAPVPTEDIGRAILVLRGQRVILDRELAAIYGVSTGRLNEAVKRNAERFPADFMFQLTAQEIENLKSQFAILKLGWAPLPPFRLHRARRHPGSQRSQLTARRLRWGVYVVRAFVQLRELLSSNKELAAIRAARSTVGQKTRQAR